MTDRCSLVSADLGEPLPGTAAHATAWLLLEDPGPWGAKVLRECTVEPTVAAGLEQRADDAGVRVQLIRRTDRHPEHPGRRVVFLVHSGPGDPWIRRIVIEEEQIADLDPSIATRPAPPDLGDAVDGDLFLVCTHAKRDACCAKFGRPIVDAVARKLPDATWETSHTGGHRFAGVMLALPDGLTFGRLDAPAAVQVAKALLAGRLPLKHYRGRSVDGGPAQAAEVAVRREVGTRGREGVRVVSAVEDGGAKVIHLDVDGRPWRSIVASRPMGVLRSVSCGGTPEDRVAHEVVAVGPAVPTDAG